MNVKYHKTLQSDTAIEIGRTADWNFSCTYFGKEESKNSSHVNNRKQFPINLCFKCLLFKVAWKVTSEEGDEAWMDIGHRKSSKNAYGIYSNTSGFSRGSVYISERRETTLGEIGIAINTEKMDHPVSYASMWLGLSWFWLFGTNAAIWNKWRWLQ